MNGFLNLEKEKVIEKTDDSVSLEFSVPCSSYYFDGHFPAFPILPAVAQMEIVVRFASRYLGTGLVLFEIRRIKFSTLVLPETALLLKLSKKDTAVTFTISSVDGKTTYSTGTVVTGNL